MAGTRKGKVVLSKDADPSVETLVAGLPVLNHWLGPAVLNQPVPERHHAVVVMLLTLELVPS